MARLSGLVRLFAVFLSLSFIYSMSSCASLRMQNRLDQHSKYLSDLIEWDADPEIKLELIALDFIDMFNESLQFRKARQSHNYIKKYLDRNELHLDALYNEIENWYSDLTILEKGRMIGRQAKKPYVKELKKLIPEVEKNLQRKIRVYKRIYRFFNVFFQ